MGQKDNCANAQHSYSPTILKMDIKNDQLKQCREAEQKIAMN